MGNINLKKEANLQLQKWEYLLNDDESKKELLYKSISIINSNGTVVANQFIVEVDVPNKRFLIFSLKNPVGYKKFYLPFSYLNFLGKIDGDEHIIKIITPQRKNKNYLIEEFEFYNRNFLS